MGSTALPLISLRMTIGMLVTGSIMRPRIFISTSMTPSQSSLHHSYDIAYTLAHQRVGAGASHPHRKVLTHQRLRAAVRMREVERTIVRRAADPLSQRLVT